jgi:hypothetical protein
VLALQLVTYPKHEKDAAEGVQDRHRGKLHKHSQVDDQMNNDEPDRRDVFELVLE